MGRKDHATKEYMKDDARFADAFNYFMYEGKKIIVPERLEEQDAAELLNFYAAEDKLISKQEFRDVLKRSVLMHDENAYYLLLGIENQSEVNYAMPVRNYVYDAMNYAEQVAGIAKKHRKDRDVKGTEFLSGFKKTDKLIPVITLVILWNSGGWNGPRSLHEMLEVRDETILKFVPNYHLNLIVPEEVKDFDRFQTELKLVMEFLAVKNDGKKLRELMERDRELYSDMDFDSAKVLEACTDLHFYNKDSEEGGVNMCKGMEEWLEEEVEKEREKMCKGMEEWLEEAMEKEREKMCKQIAFELHTAGMETETICNIVKAPIEAVQEWFASVDV